MQQRHPEGYRKLLVFQKAEANHELVLQLIRFIPRNERATRDLADQLAASARSVPANIAEGWKRRYTNEYLTFLGYAEASNDEIKGDARRMALGFYSQLRGIKGLMGEKGLTGERGWYTGGELEKLRFYPLDESLPPVVRLYLRCKEMDYLLSRLKASLGQKMEEEKTMPTSEKIRRRIRQQESADREMEKYIESIGLIRLQNGQVIKKEEYDRRKAAGEDVRLFSQRY